jgi:TolB protein
MLEPLVSVSRRRTLAALAALGAGPALAQLRIDIAGVGGTRVPVAIVDFRDESKSPQPIAAIVRADLERSGLFRSVDAPAGLSETSVPVWTDWRARQADALAAGSVSRLADGRLDIRFKLWDVVKGTEVVGEAHAVLPEDARLAAHRIADTIYQKLTGDRGVFATRMAYVTKAGRRFSLVIADADGEGAKVALASPEPIISPAWAPNGRELAYVSFESGKATVRVQDVQTGGRRVLADFKGTNSAPAWSPDGQQLALSLSREGGTQLFVINRDGSGLRRIAQSGAIDTEACYSPDGSKIYFVSDRGGSPQVYRMPASGGSAERVTFGGSYNISPRQPRWPHAGLHQPHRRCFPPQRDGPQHRPGPADQRRERRRESVLRAQRQAHRLCQPRRRQGGADDDHAGRQDQDAAACHIGRGS